MLVEWEGLFLKSTTGWTIFSIIIYNNKFIIKRHRPSVAIIILPSFASSVVFTCRVHRTDRRARMGHRMAAESDPFSGLAALLRVQFLLQRGRSLAYHRNRRCSRFGAEGLGYTVVYTDGVTVRWWTETEFGRVSERAMEWVRITTSEQPEPEQHTSGTPPPNDVPTRGGGGGSGGAAI